jgi:hypothetical protein
MESVHVKEANSEVLIFLDKNLGCKLFALEEASKAIQREIIRERDKYGSKPTGYCNPDR